MTEDLVPQRGVRASDAEREAAVTRLQTAMAEGRITVEEFSERARPPTRRRPSTSSARWSPTCRPGRTR